MHPSQVRLHKPAVELQPNAHVTLFIYSHIRIYVKEYIFNQRQATRFKALVEQKVKLEANKVAIVAD